MERDIFIIIQSIDTMPLPVCTYTRGGFRDKRFPMVAEFGHCQQLIEMRLAEQNRLETAHSSLHPNIKNHLDWLISQIQEIETEIDNQIKKDEALQEKSVAPKRSRSRQSVEFNPDWRITRTWRTLQQTNRRLGRSRSVPTRERNLEWQKIL